MGVSYLVSLFNKSRYIRGTLEAIAEELAATGGEIVVYDDASTDDSVAIASNCSCADRVRILRGEVNRGCVFAADALIATASHEYTRFIDADDRIAPGSTLKMRAAMESSGCDFIFGRIHPEGSVAEDSGEPVRLLPAPLRQILRNTEYNPSSMIIRTAVLKEVAPLPENFRHSQDFIMGVRMGLQNRRIGTLGLTCAFTPAETGSGNLSSRMAEMFGDMARFVHDESASDAFPLPELQYATQRYARRCLRYFRRSGHDQPTWRQTMALQAMALGGAILSRHHCRHCLRFIADMFHRDRGVVLVKR